MRICKHCDHFVEENTSTGTGLAPFLHLDDGEQEYDHDAEPFGPDRTLLTWQLRRPDLFHKFADGKIGPNSTLYIPRRGKVDECPSESSPAPSASTPGGV